MIFKTNYNILKQAEDTSDKIIKLRSKYSKLDFSALKIEFEKQKQKYNNLGKNNLKNLDIILEDVYAIMDSVILKIMGFNLHKVQLIGAILLHHGDLAEMKTGEGKTITATLPAVLNSISGKGVHIITVNEYLAQRDAQEMGLIYEKIGITVGCVTKDTKISKKMEYAKDIIYITNSELGFDYLRDNMVRAIGAKSQGELNFAIIDEADSVLIDEARTPLIISGGGTPKDEVYKSANACIKAMNSECYELDLESKTVSLTSSGVSSVENFFKISNLYAVENSEINHRTHNALQAYNIFTKEVEYTVRDNKVEIIDIFTGRILDGRMYSNGLHQAIQAKEGTEITPESVTHATITYQNLFRLYKKLSGMSGTAKTEEEEFLKIYNMRVFVVPTNKPIIRIDHIDSIYSTKKYKWDNVINDIEHKLHTKQPILIGTRSVEDSEHLHNLLIENNIKHEVLNAKNHGREAEIIAKAGQKGSITLSTNMAGRGTDIKLGEGVRELGGLYVIGTERHESRRIDNQLRGRSGRQGDIGETRFYISLEDEIMIRSGSEKIKKVFNAKNPEKLESKLVTKALTAAQKRIEGMNFDMRKNVIEYDNVLNQQRQIIYKQRDNFLISENLTTEVIIHYIQTVCKEIINMPYFRKGGRLDFDLLLLSMQKNLFGSGIINKKDIENKSDIEVIEILQDRMIDKFNLLYEKWNDKSINLQIRNVLISFMDKHWQDHINQLQKLRATIEYRQYAQKKPIQIYIEEADDLFKQTREKVYHGVIKTLLSSSVVQPQEAPTKTINIR